MFGPITNTLLKVIGPTQVNMVKRAGVGLHMGITPRSSQGHLKVIFQVKSAKKGKNSKFLLFLLQLY